MRKQILIISDPTDLHARAVAYAIHRKGHHCTEFFTHDFPTSVTISLSLRGNSGGFHYRVRSAEPLNTFGDRTFDSVWIRRQNGAWLPDWMHRGDRDVALRQADRMLWDFVGALSDSHSKFLVNTVESERRAESESFQLQQARSCGFAIPETLIGNDPNDIRAFVRNCGGTAVHKLLRHGAWIPEDRSDHVYL